MDDPRTPTERLAATPFGAGAEDGECLFCGKPAADGTLCDGCYDERWEFVTDAEQDEHARLERLTLRGECIRCGGQIEAARFRLGATECENCKPQRAAA